MFSITAGYVDGVIGNESEPSLMEIHMIYSGMVGNLCSNSRLSGMIDRCIAWLRKKVQIMKTKTAKLFKDQC